MARRGRPHQFDRVFHGDCARRAILLRALHQMISGCPVAMAIEQRADYAAIQHSIKSFVFLLRFPFCNDLAIFWEASNMQSFGIRWTTTPAVVVGCVVFLK